MRAPAAMEASSMVRRVSMVLSLIGRALVGARLGRDNSRLCGQRTRCAYQCCIAFGDGSVRQMPAVLEPDPSVELLRQRLAIVVPHGGIEPVQQAGQADAGAVEAINHTAIC